MKTKVRIKVGDNVYILAGKDQGTTAKIEKINTEKQTVLVENVNLAKKHVKPRAQQPGGIITVNLPIDISNVQLVCPSCEKRTRVTYQGEGKNKQRICKKCSVSIDEVKKETKKTKK